MSAIPHPVEPLEARKSLLVLASTYPRWAGDHEPGFVHELCRRLASRFDVTVIVPDAPGADPSGGFEGVEVVRFRYAPRRMQTLVNDGGIVANLRRHPWKWCLVPAFAASMFFSASRALVRRHFDVAHAHWIIPQGFLLGLARAGTRRRPPFLLTAHGADLFAFKGRAFGLLKRAVARQASVVTVVSQFMRQQALELGIPSDRLLVRPMGVDLAAFSPDPETARARAELLFVGRLVEKKGLRHLLAALPAILAEVPDVRLTVAGFGPEESHLRDLARDMGIADVVTFAGAVNHRQLPALYRRATMLVAPFVEAVDGDQEGLGLVMVEALACGCPVVTTAIGAVKDVFGGSWPEYCAAPGDPGSLAHEVLRLLEDPERGAREVLGQAPALRARFDWDAVADGYAALLHCMARRED